MKSIKFVVHGDPFGKQRPVFHNGYIATTPKKTLDYEEYVRSEYMVQVRREKLSDAACLEVDIDAYFAIPDGTPQWQIPLMLEKLIRPPKKPDWDNIGKVITDALNKIAYHDDAYIVTGIVRKYFSDKPRVEVEIKELACLTPKARKKDLVKFYEIFENLKKQENQGD